MEIHRLSPAILAIALGMLAASCAAAPQENPLDEVRNLIGYKDKDMARTGFQPSGDVRTGTLKQGQEDTVEVILEAGKTNSIAGECDDDCHALDFVLLDAKGTELTRFAQLRAEPVVTFQPETTGVYRLRVTMARCDDEPCAYALQTYRKDATPFPAAPVSLGSRPTTLPPATGASP